MFFTGPFRSPSQNYDQFSDFCDGFSILLHNINDQRPPCLVTVCSFNAKFLNWYPFNTNSVAAEAL